MSSRSFNDISLKCHLGFKSLKPPQFLLFLWTHPRPGQVQKAPKVWFMENIRQTIQPEWVKLAQTYNNTQQPKINCKLKFSINNDCNMMYARFSPIIQLRTFFVFCCSIFLIIQIHLKIYVLFNCDSKLPNFD